VFYLSAYVVNRVFGRRVFGSARAYFVTVDELLHVPAYRVELRSGAAGD
jgi:hypothetical protein